MAFEKKVKDALQAVERVLEVERKPRLAAEVDHSYGDKYALANTVTNTAIITLMNCLDKLGLNADILTAIDKTNATTLRFEASAQCKFIKDVVVDVPVDTTHVEGEVSKSTGIFGNTTKTKVFKAVKHVKEYHYDLETNWSISIYSGTSIKEKKILKSRASNMILITQVQKPPVKITELEEVSLTWLLGQITTETLATQFQIDVEDSKTITPRRNEAIEKALEFAGIDSTAGVQHGKLHAFLTCIDTFFESLRSAILSNHNPAVPSPDPVFTAMRQNFDFYDYSIFNPILPLMEDDNQSATAVEERDSCKVLSKEDMTKLTNEHARSLEEALENIAKSTPSDQSPNAFACSERMLMLLSFDMLELMSNYSKSVSYIESMMESQLIAAIGKRLESDDIDKFTTFHNARLLQKAPNQFSHAIRQPEHYPVGLVSIEDNTGDRKCIQTHSRIVNASSTVKLPLAAATILELAGDQVLHGWMNQRFGTKTASGRIESFELTARARQFSSFILVIGTMNGPSTLEPKDSIIIQNKDEVLIPLLLEELPTAKEFKDAIKSLSPEQQRFAKAYRSMQLESSVFGICVVQIKPQLEALLSLPPNSLDKEMKLTQDLMELFVEYQVPSDLLSYNGATDDVAVEDKVSNVREHVKSVMEVIEGEKEKHLKNAALNTAMSIEKHIQQDLAHSEQRSGLHDVVNGALIDPRPPTMFYKSATAPARRSGAAKLRAPSGGAQKERFRSVQSSAAPVPRMAKMSAVAAASPGRGTVSQVSQPAPQSYHGRTEHVLADRSSTGVDFTLIPKTLDVAIENNGEGSALRSTIIKTRDTWTRHRQENLLTASKDEVLTTEDLKKEKHKAFDLLDALSRSGSLPIQYSELHVIVALTHCFDKSVMETVICDNVNPIEKLELSTLLLASAIHGVPAREMIKDDGELLRLKGSFPLLLKDEEKKEEAMIG